MVLLRNSFMRPYSIQWRHQRSNVIISLQRHVKIKQSRKLNIEKIIMVFENVIFKLWKSLDIQNRKLFGVKIVTWWRTMSSMGLLLTEGRLSFLLSLLKTKELFVITHIIWLIWWNKSRDLNRIQERTHALPKISMVLNDG